MPRYVPGCILSHVGDVHLMIIHVRLSSDSGNQVARGIGAVVATWRSIAINLRPVRLQAGHRRVVLELPACIIIVLGFNRNDPVSCERVKNPGVGGPFAIRIQRNNLAVINSIGRESAIEANGKIRARRPNQEIPYFGKRQLGRTIGVVQEHFQSVGRDLSCVEGGGSEGDLVGAREGVEQSLRWWNEVYYLSHTHEPDKVV